MQSWVVLLQSNAPNRWNVGIVGMTIVVFYILSYVVSQSLKFGMFGVMGELYGNGAYWFTSIVVSTACLLPSIARQAHQFLFRPTISQRMYAWIG